MGEPASGLGLGGNDFTSDSKLSKCDSAFENVFAWVCVYMLVLENGTSENVCTFEVISAEESMVGTLYTVSEIRSNRVNNNVTIIKQFDLTVNSIRYNL